MKQFIRIVCLAFIMQSCAAQPKSELIADALKTITKERLSYYLYFPESYAVQTNQEFPLLLFLHGGGEAGGNLKTLKAGGPPKLLQEGKEFPFLILAPKNPNEKKWWNTRAVHQLLDSVVTKHRVDKKRLYLTGISRGGAAAWEMAVQYPNTFAAMAVVCGMTPLPYASWIDKKMPIWVFHGEEDVSVPVAESEEMVAKLKGMQYEVKFTKYPNVGHNAWDKAYQTEALYEWFMRQERQE